MRAHYTAYSSLQHPPLPSEKESRRQSLWRSVVPRLNSRKKLDSGQPLTTPGVCPTSSGSWFLSSTFETVGVLLSMVTRFQEQSKRLFFQTMLWKMQMVKSYHAWSNSCILDFWPLWPFPTLREEFHWIVETSIEIVGRACACVSLSLFVYLWVWICMYLYVACMPSRFDLQSHGR